jgi:hypothetical protein
MCISIDTRLIILRHNSLIIINSYDDEMRRSVFLLNELGVCVY